MMTGVFFIFIQWIKQFVKKTGEIPGTCILASNDLTFAYDNTFIQLNITNPRIDVPRFSSLQIQEIFSSSVKVISNGENISWVVSIREKCCSMNME